MDGVSWKMEELMRGGLPNSSLTILGDNKPEIPLNPEVK